MDRAVFERLDALEGEHWWFAARRDILGHVLERLSRRAGLETPRILEAGCGTGGNLAMLSGLGTVEAFEHDEAALAVARGKAPDLRLEQGTLPHALPAVQARHDFVVAFDVIEHVERDRDSLAALRTRLKPGGALVMTVPAWPSLWSRHDETHHHFRRYTPAHLRAELEAAGYAVEHLGCYNTLLFPAVVAMRALKRWTGREDADDAMPSPFLNRLLRRVFAFERHWIGRITMPFGVSLIAVARPAGAAAPVTDVLAPA